MKLLDRLIMKAAGGDMEWTMMAFVKDFVEGLGYEAHYGFWDGVPLSGYRNTASSYHSTREGAVAAVEKAKKEFPYPIVWAHIFIDDYGEGEAVAQT